jgi:hypothetical protein
MQLISDFPWDDVMENKRTELNLGEWDASTIPEWARRELVSGTLRGNTVIRAVMIKGKILGLSDGWATTELDLENRVQKAVRAVPATVWLVVQTCVGVTKLNLRCSAPGKGVCSSGD